MTTTDSNQFEDWYRVLNIEQDATTTQIQNAYRKLAKKYHPDKNKSQEAVVMFEKITIANVTLCNVDKRLLFDSQLFAKREKKRKEHEMDNARKKMKQDLLNRENQFKKKRENDYNSQRNVQFENEQFKQNYINELKKQEQAQQATAASQQDGNSEIDGMVIKLKWKTHLGYTQDNIMDILSSYGDVSTFTMVSSSSYTIALATFTQLESIYQILVRKDDLKNNKNIKIERLKGNNHTTTFNSSNGSTTTTTTSSTSSSSSSSTTTTTTTTTSSSNNNNCNNNINNFNNNIDEDEDDILLQMKNFKKK